MFFRKKMGVKDYCTARLDALLSVERHEVWSVLREQCKDSALSGIKLGKYLDHTRAIMYELLIIAITKSFRGNVGPEAHFFGNTYFSNHHVSYLLDIAHEYNQAFAATPYDGIAGIVLLFSNQLTDGRLKEETKERLHAEFYGVLASLFDDFKSIKLTSQWCPNEKNWTKGIKKPHPPVGDLGQRAALRPLMYIIRLIINYLISCTLYIISPGIVEYFRGGHTQLVDRAILDKKSKIHFWNKIQMSGVGLFLGFLFVCFVGSIFGWWWLIPAILGIGLSMFGYAKTMRAAGRDPATTNRDEVM